MRQRLPAYVGIPDKLVNGEQRIVHLAADKPDPDILSVQAPFGRRFNIGIVNLMALFIAAAESLVS